MDLWISTDDWQVTLYEICIQLIHPIDSYPPKKLLGDWGLTPDTSFCLNLTIKSELTYFLICSTIEWAGVNICWFAVANSTPTGLQEAFRADCISTIYQKRCECNGSLDRIQGSFSKIYIHKVMMIWISGSSPTIGRSHFVKCVYR